MDYLGHVKKLIGAEQTEKVELPNGASVEDLLLKLSGIHGEPFKKTVYEPGDSDLKSNFILSVNGLLLNQLNGIRTKLKDGDTVIIMPIVSGG